MLGDEGALLIWRSSIPSRLERREGELVVTSDPGQGRPQTQPKARVGVSRRLSSQRPTSVERIGTLWRGRKHEGPG